MNKANEALSLRIHKDNPNHHLWNNHGIWYLHITVHRDFAKERRRVSLKTKSLEEARQRRDEVIFSAALANKQGAAFHD